MPSADAWRKPRKESDRFRGLRVFLALGLSLEAAGEDLKGNLEVLVDDIGGGSWAAISGIDELARSCCGNQCHSREVEHWLGLADLAVLEGEPIALEGPEGLLDSPTQAMKM